MSISVETVRFEADRMWIGLSDGRVIGVPLAWFPRLMRASVAEREAFEISPFGIHWEGLDEDVSVEGLLAGRGDRGCVGGEAARDLTVSADNIGTSRMRMGAAGLLLYGVASLPISAQTTTDAANIAGETRRLVDLVEANTGLPLRTVIENRFAAAAFSEANQQWLSQVKPVDYGYLVRDASGNPIDVFGPTTPVEENSMGGLSVKGYGGPVNASVERVRV